MYPIKVVWCFFATSVSLLDIQKRLITPAMANTMAVSPRAQVASAGIVPHVILASPDRFLALLHPTQPAPAPVALREPMQVSSCTPLSLIASSVSNVSYTHQRRSHCLPTVWPWKHFNLRYDHELTRPLPLMNCQSHPQIVISRHNDPAAGSTSYTPCPDGSYAPSAGATACITVRARNPSFQTVCLKRKDDLFISTILCKAWSICYRGICNTCFLTLRFCVAVVGICDNVLCCPTRSAPRSACSTRTTATQAISARGKAPAMDSSVASRPDAVASTAWARPSVSAAAAPPPRSECTVASQEPPTTTSFVTEVGGEWRRRAEWSWWLVIMRRRRRTALGQPGSSGMDPTQPVAASS
jgi:hypothetical protein